MALMAAWLTTCVVLGPSHAASATADDLDPIPGVREFSGRVIAGPRLHAPVRAEDAAVLREIGSTGERILIVPASESDAAFVRRLRAAGAYEYVEPDWLVYPASTPDDPLFASQYQHVFMESAAAWSVTTGAASIICAFVDTGFLKLHEDLTGRFVSGYNSASRVREIDGGDTTDINGHGTSVAGAACATGNNGLGVAGVNWGASVMPVRTSNSVGGSAFLTDILDGARWAAENGARVVSVSYNGVSGTSVQTTGAYLRSIGSQLLWAAGNGRQNMSSSFDWPDVIIVGATDEIDGRASFSNYGAPIDVMAPGNNIWTTRSDYGYGQVSGTSFSTPMTAAALGLILSVRPALTPAAAETILERSCDDLGDPGEDSVFGWGRVNLRRAVEMAEADWNADGSIDDFDFFDFLTAFASGNADFNGDTSADDFDYFDFLNAFSRF